MLILQGENKLFRFDVSVRYMNTPSVDVLDNLLGVDCMLGRVNA